MKAMDTKMRFVVLSTTMMIVVASGWAHQQGNILLKTSIV